jgi:hypothetical protein
MDRFHREPMPDTTTARACEFCMRRDPGFTRRKLKDQLVQNSHSASGHLTEEGHVRHRSLELGLKLSLNGRRALLLPAV